MKFIVKDIKRKNNAIEYLRQQDISKPLEVFIRDYKPKRSNSQNNLMWMWYKHIADHIGMTSDDLHEMLKVRWLGTYTKNVEGIDLIYPNSTKKLSTKEMADYLEKLENLGISLEVVLPIPDDYKFAMMYD